MIQAFFGALAVLIGPLIIKALLGLGIGFAVYTGLDTGIQAIESAIQGLYGGLPSAMYSIVAMLGVFDGINMTVSAMVAAIGIRTAQQSLTLVKTS